MPNPSTIDEFIREQAQTLRANDKAPTSKEAWATRRQQLREQFRTALGPMPEKACDLQPTILGILPRDGYNIERLVFQSRPDVWVTANAYVPALKEGQKVPAVLVVHGHWRGARRDPVVQARCLGLVKLGFFVLAVDAFGAGERYTNPAEGTYHGALYGSTLWPLGYSLLGMQVYDNMRAVDYLQTRKEVNGKFGITGASGGGNQSMNAGAFDERFAAVVPVCSVGTYQVYLRAACCVCEVLPNALTFTEEGDILGLVAPRALMVTSATKDAIQFSPGEAVKSLERAKAIFELQGVGSKVKHVIVESGHDYNRPMREAMYGWMTLHLKGEGEGTPIAEPAHTLEKWADLGCYPNSADRPKGFLTPPLFAAQVGRELVAKANKLAPTHPEMWEATANMLRTDVKKALGGIEVVKASELATGDHIQKDGVPAWTETMRGEGGMPLTVQWYGLGKTGTAILLHLGGSEEASKHPAVAGLLGQGYRVAIPDLRGVGKTKPKVDAIGGAPDHNSAEHGMWIGRPLLGQWITDTITIAHTIPQVMRQARLLVGIGPAATIALGSAVFAPERFDAIVAMQPMASYITEGPYAAGTPMGLLAFGVLQSVDVPHLAALAAPKRLSIVGGNNSQGKPLNEKELQEAFTFTTNVYKTVKQAERLTITTTMDWKTL